MIPMRSLLLFFSCAILFAQTPPKEWTDPATGHRVIRLTDEPGSASLYFNQNGYTPDGKKGWSSRRQLESPRSIFNRAR